MLSKVFCAGAFMLLLNVAGFGQTIARNFCKLHITNYNLVTGDALLEFSTDVRMSDCIDHLVITSSAKKKPLVFRGGIEHYYLNEDDTIVFRVPLGNMNKFMKRKKAATLKISVVSYTGYEILHKEILLEREKIQRSGDYDL